MNFHWLLREQKGIPVLMYHRIFPELSERNTHTPQQLKQQLYYLKETGYNTLSLSEFIAFAKGEKRSEEKNILITFDDGYHNNLVYAYPMLQELNFKATFFIIADTLEGNIDTQDPVQRKMNIEELRSLNSETIQLAMHGYHHENFKKTSLTEIKNAIEKSIAIFKEHNIPLHKSIAYPYGGRPQDKDQFEELKQWMKGYGIEAAFRIGNAVAKIPAGDIYDIKRIDMRGTDSFENFKIKLRKGKLNPF